MLALGPAVITVLSSQIFVITETRQGILVAAGYKDNITTAAAIAAVRAAFTDKLFAAEAHTAVAALPGTDRYLYLVNEVHATSQYTEGSECKLASYVVRVVARRLPSFADPRKTSDTVHIADIYLLAVVGDCHDNGHVS